KELEASSGDQTVCCLERHTRRRFPVVGAKEPIVIVDHSSRGGLARGALYPQAYSKHILLKDSEKEFFPGLGMEFLER
ncbi:hypothetical protein AC249_AIPGENE1153, partial [Exaiptasia diaphana]